MVSNNDKLSTMESKLNNRIDEAINHSKLLLDNISGMKQDIANQRQDTDELKVQVKTLMEEKTVLERKVANLELATTKKISVFEDMIPEAAQQPSVIDLSTNEQFHELEQNILRITESATDDKKSGNCEIERLDQILRTNTKDMDDIKTSFKEFSHTILLSLESINPSARPKSTSTEAPVTCENVRMDIQQNPVIFKSSQKTAQGSKFQAFCCAISNQVELDAFVASVDQIYPDTHSATHHIVTYTYTKAGETIVQADDDGEFGASERVLETIREHNLQNVAILVCRWYGGTHLHKLRFQLIHECVLEVLKSGKFITSPNNAAPKSVLILSDSTGAGININRMVPGHRGQRDTAPTLDSCINKLKTIPPKYNQIIIQCGIND